MLQDFWPRNHIVGITGRMVATLVTRVAQQQHSTRHINSWQHKAYKCLSSIVYAFKLTTLNAITFNVLCLPQAGIFELCAKAKMGKVCCFVHGKRNLWSLFLWDALVHLLAFGEKRKHQQCRGLCCAWEDVLKLSHILGFKTAICTCDVGTCYNPTANLFALCVCASHTFCCCSWLNWSQLNLERSWVVRGHSSRSRFVEVSYCVKDSCSSYLR